MCDVRLGTLNINGARDDVKMASLFSLTNAKKLNVVSLQETHSTADNEADWRREWSGEVFLSHKSSSSGGVGILFSKDFLSISCVADEIIKGRLLKIRAEFEKVKMVFINVHAPPVGTERLAFLDTLNNVIKNCSSEEYSFIAGDFNCTENAALDRNHREPHAASSSSLAKIVETSELCDIWRHCHQNQRQHTWTHSRDNSSSVARLDRFYCFKHQVNVVEGCTIFSCRNITSFSCTGFHFYKRWKMQ